MISSHGLVQMYSFLIIYTSSSRMDIKSIKAHSIEPVACLINYSSPYKLTYKLDDTMHTLFELKELHVSPIYPTNKTLTKKSQSLGLVQ